MTFIPPGDVPQDKPLRPINERRRIDFAMLIGEAPEAPSEAFKFPLLKCDVNGFLRVSRAPNSGVTFSRFTAADGTTTPKQLDIGFLGANRDSIFIVNTSDKDVFVNLGFTVSTQSLVRILGPYAPNDPTKSLSCQWDVPLSSPFFGGAVWGMWPEPTTTGGIIVTELT